MSAVAPSGNPLIFSHDQSHCRVYPDSGGIFPFWQVLLSCGFLLAAIGDAALLGGKILASVS